MSEISFIVFYFWSFEICEHILRIRKLPIGLDSSFRQLIIYLDPILIYISLWIDCVFEIHKFAVCFPLFSLLGHNRVTDENLLFETA